MNVFISSVTLVSVVILFVFSIRGDADTWSVVSGGCLALFGVIYANLNSSLGERKRSSEVRCRELRLTALDYVGQVVSFPRIESIGQAKSFSILVRVAEKMVNEFEVVAKDIGEVDSSVRQALVIAFEAGVDCGPDLSSSVDIREARDAVLGEGNV